MEICMLVLPPGLTAGLALFCPRSGDWCPLGPACRSQAASHLVLHHHGEQETSSEVQWLPVFSHLSGPPDKGGYSWSILKGFVVKAWVQPAEPLEGSGTSVGRAYWKEVCLWEGVSSKQLRDPFLIDSWLPHDLCIATR